MATDKELTKAKIYFASGQLEKSIEAFSAAEKKGCNPVDVCLSRGAVQMALGNFKKAEEDFTRVLEEDCDNERAYYFRGIALFALGEYEKAVKDLTLSLTRNNSRGIAHLARGMAYAELGDEEFATLDFSSAKAFSSEEFKSFKKLFGGLPAPCIKARELMAKENAPWNNLLNRDSAGKLIDLLN
jgi:tetratricopeptide (TPR) repeat protein